MNIRQFHLLNVCFAAVVIAVSLVDAHAAIRLAALTGTMWLTALLVLPRLNSNGTYRYIWPAVQFVITSRKYLGLWAAAWFSAHAILATALYFGGMDELFRSIPGRPVIIFELLSLGIMLLLASLSNSWSMRNIKWWKYIQLAVWAIPAMALVSSFIAARDFLGQPPLLFIPTILLALCILTGVSMVFSRQKRLADWLRLGFLSLGVVMACIAVLLYAHMRGLS